MNVQRKARYRVKKEYVRFKRRLMCRGTKEEVWNACRKIHFFECLREYFDFNARIPEKYLELAAAEPELMERAWRLYLREERLEYGTWTEIEELLEELLMRWRVPAAG